MIKSEENGGKSNWYWNKECNFRKGSYKENKHKSSLNFKVSENTSQQIMNFEIGFDIW